MVTTEPDSRSQLFSLTSEPLEDIFIDIGEPDWLRDFSYRQDSNYMYVECNDCHDDVLIEEGYTLYDIKVWAYCHLEECGK